MLRYWRKIVFEKINMDAGTRWGFNFTSIISVEYLPEVITSRALAFSYLIIVYTN